LPGTSTQKAPSLELGSKLIELIAQAPQVFERAVPE